MLDSEDKVHLCFLETVWWLGVPGMPFVLESLVLAQLLHFKVGAVFPFRVAKFTVKFHGVRIVPWYFVTIHVFGCCPE